ncbi:MAK10-like protein [Tanacetum coccineum]
MERFKNSIFKQREEINIRMAKMFGLLKELTVKWRKKRGVRNNGVVSENIVEPNKSIVAETLEGVDRDDEVEDKTKGGLKYMNALVDQGSDVNVMPLSTYNRVTGEKLVKTDIRLSLISQSNIYPLGIAENVLVEIADFIYPVDFVILDIKEDRKRPFILGTPFLTTAKAKIRFDKGQLTLKSGKNKTNFFKTPEYFCKFKEREEDDIGPVTPTSIISKLILKWEERIKLHQEKEMEFNQWRSKVFYDGRSVLVNDGCEERNEGGVT